MAADADSTSGGDADLKRREEKMVEKLAALDARRQEEAERRRAESADAADPRESVAAFLADFASRKAAVEASLSAQAGQAGGGDPEWVKETLEGLSGDILAMEKSVAEATYFLPAYDARSSATVINDLRDQVAKAREALVPKKKFAFSRKKKAAAAGTEQQVAAPAPAAADPAAAKAEAEAEGLRREESRIAEAVAAGRGLKGLRGEVVVKWADELKGLDYTLSDLEDCTVFLLGPMSALRVHGLRRCTLVAAPIKGSSFVDKAEDSVLHLASHQIRIHTTKDTQFYVRVKSKPIIEHSTGTSFAPFAAPGFEGEGGAEQMRAAALDEETGLWNAVEDFGWLRATHSPNWRALPEGERKPAPLAPGQKAPIAAAPTASAPPEQGGAALDDDPDEL